MAPAVKFLFDSWGVTVAAEVEAGAGVKTHMLSSGLGAGQEEQHQHWAAGLDSLQHGATKLVSLQDGATKQAILQHHIGLLNWQLCNTAAYA